MHTRPIAIAAGLVLAGGSLCWTVSGGDADEVPTPARSTRPSFAEFPRQSGIPSALHAHTVAIQPSETPPPSRLARARPIQPAPLLDCETYWTAVQPIFDTLPHMDKADIHKLDYFCPGDFNKDDQVDDQDLALFARTWADESSPLFNWCDLTHDGIVDEADAVEFLREFREGPRNCQELKDRRSTIC